jgi:hypothetical protein
MSPPVDPILNHINSIYTFKSFRSRHVFVLVSPLRTYLTRYLFSVGLPIKYKMDCHFSSTVTMKPKLRSHAFTCSFQILVTGVDRCVLTPIWIYVLTYSRSWALLEEPPIVQPLKNLPAFYGSRTFNTVVTRALHWSLSWAISIQSTPSHPISQRSILILSTRLLLGLPSGVFPSGFSFGHSYASWSY